MQLSGYADQCIGRVTVELNDQHVATVAGVRFGALVTVADVNVSLSQTVIDQLRGEQSLAESASVIVEEPQLSIEDLIRNYEEEVLISCEVDRQQFRQLRSIIDQTWFSSQQPQQQH